MCTFVNTVLYHLPITPPARSSLSISICIYIYIYIYISGLPHYTSILHGSCQLSPSPHVTVTPRCHIPLSPPSVTPVSTGYIAPLSQLSHPPIHPFLHHTCFRHDLRCQLLIMDANTSINHSLYIRAILTGLRDPLDLCSRLYFVLIHHRSWLPELEVMEHGWLNWLECWLLSNLVSHYFKSFQRQTNYV